MATRRMRIKAVANVGARNRARPLSSGYADISSPSSLPPNSPLPSNVLSPFAAVMSPGSPVPVGLADSCVTRPIPCKSPGLERPSPSRSPVGRPPPSSSPLYSQSTRIFQVGQVQRPSPSTSPLQSPPSPQRPHRPVTPVQLPPSGSLLKKVDRSPSPSPQLVLVSPTSPTKAFNSRHFDQASSPKPYSPGNSVTPLSPYGLSVAAKTAPNRGSNSSLHPAELDDAEKKETSNGNCEVLRQRLQKPPSNTSFASSKYQTLRKEFFSKYSDPSLVPNPNELTILHFAFWNPTKSPKKIQNRTPSTSEGGSTTADLQEPSTSGSAPIPARRATFAGLPTRSSTGENNNEEGQKHTAEEDIATNGVAENNAPNNTQGHVGPRVTVGPDGNLIIDEKSLMVETSESKRAKKQLEEMETVSGSSFEIGSSGIFRHKKPARRGGDWSVKETVKFYRALSLCGTDFSIMSSLFPSRTRAELKAKFKREDRRNPKQISEALSCQVFDPDEGFSSNDEENGEDDILKKPEVIAIAAKSPSKKSHRQRSLDSLLKPAKKPAPTLRITNFEPCDSNSATEVIEAAKSLTDVNPIIGKRIENLLKKEHSDKRSQRNVVNLKRKIFKFECQDPRGMRAGMFNSLSLSPTNKRQCSDEDVVEVAVSTDDANQPSSLFSSLNSNNNETVLDGRSRRSKSTESCERHIQETEPSQTTADESSKTGLKKLETNVKLKSLPYRVPGPGRSGNLRYETNPEEIELEISCQ